ncbi:putative receptor-type tyrosine-protein phosphatase mosPTP-1 isoform X2 [Osmia lignaria lignaria]|uniref:putative receptor-type tyrosine-protein phosphatase mosPTP-1 isoform X2 n=1 Tax=Osmia lignaria lignaria TaxID=1437193 RepID=UPI001478A7F7|nr:tyrosine-protein phosphatase 99A isoform X2 [Osmia lignaria]
MDWWLRGWIVYIYLLRIVLRTAANSGFFDSMMGEMVVEAGKNVTLNCPGVTEDSLILMLEWRADGMRLLEYGSNTTTVWNHQNRVSLSLKNYALQFHPVTAQDSAEYTCLVNSRSTPEAVIKLMVQDVPDPPERPLLTNLTSRSVNLSWAPSANSHNNPISHYVIETRIKEEGPWNATEEIVTPNNDTYYTIENLRPFTVYSFRVSAVNAMGRSKPSKQSYYIFTLREPPKGKPIITSAYNTSASSIYLAWKAPSPDTIQGEFLGYRIRYKPRVKPHMEEKHIYIRNPAVENHKIHNLETYTQYLVSLEVFNPAGHGPATTVSVMTDEGVPTKPLNLSSHGITSTTIELSWAEPESANGIISGYRIYYMHSNYTDVQMYKTDEDDGSIIEFVLNELEPYTEYKIWVKAYTWKNEGEPSDHIIRRTDIAGPSPPLILNVTCPTHDSVYIQWARPNIFWGSIDYYFINYRIESGKRYEEIEVIAEKNHLESATIIPNLTMNSVYEIVVRGGTRSAIDNRLIIHGEGSIPRKVRVVQDCDRTPPLLPHSTRELSSGVIAGMICACVAVMLMITSFILWKPCLRPIFRKCFHTAYYFLDYPPRNVPTLQEWENSEQDGERTAVAIQKFVQHVASLHADGDIGFSKEYEFIQSESGKFTAENSQYVENKTKNRYMNILAYDHTRVQLLSCGGGPPKKGHDYVNANYIDGWQRTRAYIGTQGPLPPTFDGFWRMVWEQKVSIVVMITNLVERGRKKCDMYWPKTGSETYGYIQVTLLREDVMATYTIRTLQIRHLKRKNGINMGERIIWQYHYTGWPDHGVPEHPLPVLSFIRKSSNANPPDAGPIVVHCSAGVGRTGTYIVIDAMLKQAKCKNEVNVFGFLKHIRTQRNFLVQTEEQYVFIHHALQEAIESGETNIEANNLLEYVQNMLNPNNTNTDAWNNLEAQYKLVTSWKPKEFNLVSAIKPYNIHKNRNQDVISIETARVHLTPKPGTDGSDYINATWIAGFHCNREFIITQHPMENTIMEFWQMMWDYNAQTVVMLTEYNEEYPEFWPTEDKVLESETFRVRFYGIKETASGMILREVAVRSLQDDYELRPLIVQRPRSQPGFWPHNTNPRPFVTLIHDLHRDYQNGPIVVVDRYGGVEAAIFVLLTTLNKQLDFEKTADIYMFSKLLYMKRPGVFRSKEDYALLYQCLETTLSSKGHDEPDLYSMANGHVSTITDPTDVPTSSMQHMQVDYSPKPTMIREYATVEVNSMSDYSIPIRVDHTMEPCSSRSSESCLFSHAGNEHEKNIVMTHRNVSYHNHPGSVSVIVDANGYVTNGNMRVPPEGPSAGSSRLDTSSHKRKDGDSNLRSA